MDQYLPKPLATENIQADVKQAKTFIQEKLPAATSSLTSSTGPKTTVPEKIEKGKDRMDTMLDRGKERVDKVVDRTKENVEKVEMKMEQGKDAVKRTITEGKETLGDIGQKVSSILPTTSKSTTTSTTSNPPLMTSSTTPSRISPAPPSSSMISTNNIPDELFNDLEDIIKDSIRHKEYIEEQLNNILSYSNKTLSTDRLWQELEQTLEDSRDHSVYVTENICHFMDTLGKKIETNVPHSSMHPSKGITGSITGHYNNGNQGINNNNTNIPKKLQ